MDGLISAHATLEKRSNLSRTLQDVQTTLSLLQSARDNVAANPDATAVTMAKLKQPMKASFDKLDEDLKEVNKGLNAYQKALDKKFKKSTLPTAATEPIAEQDHLVNRAIVMHLLREGRFGVAERLFEEMNQRSQKKPQDWNGEDEDMGEGDEAQDEDEDEDGMHADDSPPNPEHSLELPTHMVGEERGWLQARFSEMYHVLDSLKTSHNLEPAIAWAREHSHTLDMRGSNLEFELCRLRFLELYSSSDSNDPEYLQQPSWQNTERALAYARETFPALGERYARETAQLLGSLAFSPDLSNSPYASFFDNPSIWTQTATSFTTEFTSMLGLSSTSPLYTSVTAGCIALPVLERYEQVRQTKSTSWSTVQELPVETPLPRGYQFHQIFVCPVSKEQSTETNPPMLLMCGHAIAKESMETYSKGKGRVKCPYCPGESAVRDARRLYI